MAFHTMFLSEVNEVANQALHTPEATDTATQHPYAVQHPYPTEDAAQAPCSAEDVFTPPIAARCSALLPYSASDVPTPGFSMDVAPPSYSADEDVALPS